jgi:hypothetical protein
MSANYQAPWHVGQHTGRIVYGADGLPICDCTVFHSKADTGRMEANAALVATAPELLAALRAVVSNCAGEPVNSAAREAKYAALYQAAAVIRKAEGRGNEQP